MITATNAARRRREEMSVPKFKALIKTPASAPFKMPANATLGVRKTTSIAQGAVIGTFTGEKVHTLAVNATAANVVRSIGYIERGVTVAPASGIAVMVNVGLGKWQLIAQG